MTARDKARGVMAGGLERCGAREAFEPPTLGLGARVSFSRRPLVQTRRLAAEVAESQTEATQTAELAADLRRQLDTEVMALRPQRQEATGGLQHATHPPSSLYLHVYICIYVYMYMYMYIYARRSSSIYLCMYIYTHPSSSRRICGGRPGTPIGWDDALHVVAYHSARYAFRARASARGRAVRSAAVRSAAGSGLLAPHDVHCVASWSQHCGSARTWGSAPSWKRA
jgi:hypothetical protein